MPPLVQQTKCRASKLAALAAVAEDETWDETWDDLDWVRSPQATGQPRREVEAEDYWGAQSSALKGTVRRCRLRDRVRSVFFRSVQLVAERQKREDRSAGDLV